MKKTTKYINARYDFGTGFWAIRDNGEVLAEGKGLDAYVAAKMAIEATATKKIVAKTFY